MSLLPVLPLLVLLPLLYLLPILLLPLQTMNVVREIERINAQEMSSGVVGRRDSRGIRGCEQACILFTRGCTKTKKKGVKRKDRLSLLLFVTLVMFVVLYLYIEYRG